MTILTFIKTENTIFSLNTGFKFILLLSNFLLFSISYFTPSLHLRAIFTIPFLQKNTPFDIQYIHFLQNNQNTRPASLLYYSIVLLTLHPNLRFLFWTMVYIHCLTSLHHFHKKLHHLTSHRPKRQSSQKPCKIKLHGLWHHRTNHHKSDKKQILTSLFFHIQN